MIQLEKELEDLQYVGQVGQCCLRSRLAPISQQALEIHALRLTVGKCCCLYHQKHDETNTSPPTLEKVGALVLPLGRAPYFIDCELAGFSNFVAQDGFSRVVLRNMFFNLDGSFEGNYEP